MTFPGHSSFNTLFNILVEPPSDGSLIYSEAASMIKDGWLCGVWVDEWNCWVTDLALSLAGTFCSWMSTAPWEITAHMFKAFLLTSQHFFLFPKLLSRLWQIFWAPRFSTKLMLMCLDDLCGTTFCFLRVSCKTISRMPELDVSQRMFYCLLTFLFCVPLKRGRHSCRTDIYLKLSGVVSVMTI